MCLTISFKTKAEAKAHKPLIAKEDIEVFKVLTDFGNSPYKYTPYTRGETKKQSATLKGTFSNTERTERNINIGLHSAATRTGANYVKRHEGGTVHKMIIPKGAKYVIGDFGGYKSYASTALFWPEKTEKKSFVRDQGGITQPEDSVLPDELIKALADAKYKTKYKTLGDLFELGLDLRKRRSATTK